MIQKQIFYEGLLPAAKFLQTVVLHRNGTLKPVSCTGVTEYFGPPPENPGPCPNFTEKVGPLHTKDILFFT